jgi:AcrR family transcriptional regulator
MSTGPGAGQANRGASADDADAVARAITQALLPPLDADPIDRIVQATLEVVADEGTAAVSFEAVAAKSGVGVENLRTQFDDVDHLLRLSFERTGAALTELVESVARPDDAVHLIVPALAMQTPYARALLRAILDGYGIDTVQKDFPLATHFVDVLTRLQEEQGTGPVDPRVAAAATVALATAWHFSDAFITRAYGLDQMDEVEVRRQLSTVLEGIIGQVTGPRLS